MKFADYNQYKAVKKRTEAKLSKHYPKIKNQSGIYMFYRVVAYIGKSSEKDGILGRCASHCISHEQHIDNSIHSRKLSCDGGQWYIVPLIYCDKSKVDEMEQLFIKEYQSKGYELYNIESGGHAERTFSEETRKKISLALKNVPKTAEHREKLRQANLGKHPSEESRKKMSKTRSKPVYQMDLQGNILQEFSSIKEASLQTKCDSSYIAKCCKGKANTCGGFKWEYKEVGI